MILKTFIDIYNLDYLFKFIYRYENLNYWYE